MRNLTPEEIKEMMNSGKFSWDITVKQKYIEPERDEQGTLYGYKVLEWNDDRFLSPVKPARWNEDGSITADETPKGNNTNGIYSVKSPNNNELREIIYWQHFRGAFTPPPFGGNSYIVKLALSGVVIEGELGFRSEHAQIISVLKNGQWLTIEEFINGHRKNNQNSYRRAEGYTREDSTETIWKTYPHKSWYTNTFTNHPNADS